MNHPRALIPATLIRRYKRFLADVRLKDGQQITVACPNTGSMKSCSEPGRPVMISDSQNPKRKYRHTLEMIQMGKTWVGINTNLPNRLVGDAIRMGVFPSLRGYREAKAEVKYGVDGRSRIDWLLRDHEAGLAPAYLEVKNTTYRVDQAAAFPDAISERGQKHLRELISVVEAGHRGVIFFFVGRSDCDFFRPCDEIDPNYGTLLRQAIAAGVEALAWQFRFTAQRVVPVRELRIQT